MSKDNSSQPGPIVPPEAAPLRTLTVAMAVMCYLACLALGALILIDRATQAWTGGISREVTVQIKPLSGYDIEEEIKKADTLLAKFAGIDSYQVLEKEAGAKLLEPWLGTLHDLNSLPVPRLITVSVDHNSPPDYVALEKALQDQVKGAKLDTHRRWQAQLTRMAGILEALAYAVLALIGLCAVTLVVFATRSVLDGNREIVDVLHLIGARDGFIARQIEGRFLRTGLTAGCCGMLIGLLTFAILGFTGPDAEPGGIADASRSLITTSLDVSWLSYFIFLAVPMTATLISLLTARIVLVRMLRGRL
jgi:cell division transport system permease protein